jgi:hypothetical protein
MDSANLLIVSLFIDISSSNDDVPENDPLELARQMSEKGITLVCYPAFGFLPRTVPD